MDLLLWIAAGLLAAVALTGGVSKTFVPKARLEAAHGGLDALSCRIRLQYATTDRANLELGPSAEQEAGQQCRREQTAYAEQRGGSISYSSRRLDLFDPFARR